jgi:DNA-binding NtrC family response regulator
MKALQAYSYPGNVRELRNMIERAVILSRTPELSERDLMFPGQAAAARPAPGFFTVELNGDGAPPPIDHVERTYVGRVLQHCGGHRTAAAHTLGISYPTFLKRLRELGLE